MQTPIPNKSLGQHWLNDITSLEAMLTAAEVAETDSILEIGPGPGALTELLVQSAAHVTAVEFDPALARDLPRRVSADNLHVVHHDILTFDLTTLTPDYKVAANIPYYLTSKLVRVLSESTNRPKICILLVQKEVARRLAANPGDLSILGVTAQFYWEISLGPIVPAKLFTPPPKVDSQIVIMHRRDEPARDLGADSDTFDVRGFFRVVKAGFGARRKTLLNSLSGGLHLSKDDTKALLDRAGIEPGLRAQNLSLAEWYRLYISQ